MRFPLLIALGLIAVIIYKMAQRRRSPTPPPLPGSRSLIGWIIFALILFGAGWGGWKLYEHRKKQEAAAPPRWEWTWKLPPGKYINCRNENASDETEAEIIPRKDGSLWFDVSYVQVGVTQHERIRLGPMGTNTWIGDRDQDDPVDHSRVELRLVAPGFYSGTITWPEGLVASCSLVMKK